MTGQSHPTTQHKYLEGAKEGKQHGVALPPLLARLVFLERAVRKGLCFPLQINFSIDVGGVDGDVPEPSTNGVDVHACAQEMSGGGVSFFSRCAAAPNSVANEVHKLRERAQQLEGAGVPYEPLPESLQRIMEDLDYQI